MDNARFGFHATRMLQHWAALLPIWIEHIERYCTTIATDAPYWYGEQTNCSLLATAAWQIPGWMALAEFPIEKQLDVSQFGRSDIWLQSSAGEEYVEAKHRWIPLRGTDRIGQLMYSLQAAIANVQQVAYLQATQKTALVFACPHCTLKQTAQRDGDIDSFLTAVLALFQNGSFDAVAWTFPECTKTLQSPRTLRVYPGILLIAKRI
jgi:hypothetical protein